MPEGFFLKNNSQIPFAFLLLKQAPKPPLCKGRFPEGAKGLAKTSKNNTSISLTADSSP